MNAEKRITQPSKKWKGQNVMERFMSKVFKSDNGCWLWTGPLNRGGYGKFTVCRVTVAAHRFAYHQLVGQIPDGLTLDHLCKTTKCVNPRHLEPVTMRVNLLRGDTFQARNAAKTHCPRGHEYNVSNTRYTKSGRQCRECSLILKEKKRRELGMRVKGRYLTKLEINYRASLP